MANDGFEPKWGPDHKEEASRRRARNVKRTSKLERFIDKPVHRCGWSFGSRKHLKSGTVRFTVDGARVKNSRVTSLGGSE